MELEKHEQFDILLKLHQICFAVKGYFSVISCKLLACTSGPEMSK